ncbi:histidine phosphatase family protein [Geothrix sp. 21YS21S-2]|uniref:histidine phosphatase family protein n=1 Tax=Geothrix sp. 21YS21S-2 TaxID=3068893 RepID=UPI0027B99C11|nr:histidine phosphatase family protein [Geothrix sp. 21YS21S-2]
MRIILARHGETQWNVEGRHQGQTFDIPLSERGREQALALGRRLGGLDIARAVASPLLRARQTAELALGDRPLTLDARLVELSHGAWEGRLTSEIQEAHPDLRRAWRETPHLVSPPGGEGFRDVEARAWPALCEACRGLGPEELAVLVTHDGVNRALLARILGLDLSRVWSFRQAPTCLNLLEGNDVDHLQVVRLNDAAHLHDLFGEVVHRKL